jgi:AcrR family transcriptional regulator
MKKRRILRVAQEMFGRHGYHATTVKMIAEEAEVAFGLVAHHFGTKENLFLTAGFEMVDRVMDKIKANPKKTKTGREAVAQFIEDYLDFTLEHPSLFPILIRCSPFSDMGIEFARELISEKFREFLDEIAIRLARGIKDGSIRPAPTPETALLIYGNIVSAVRTRFLTPYEFPNLYRETLGYIMQAIRAEPNPAPPSVFLGQHMID